MSPFVTSPWRQIWTLAYGGPMRAAVDWSASLEVDGPVHPEGWSSDVRAPGWEELTPAYQQMETR